MDPTIYLFILSLSVLQIEIQKCNQKDTVVKLIMSYIAYDFFIKNDGTLSSNVSVTVQTCEKFIRVYLKEQRYNVCRYMSFHNGFQNNWQNIKFKQCDLFEVYLKKTKIQSIFLSQNVVSNFFVFNYSQSHFSEDSRYVPEHIVHNGEVKSLQIV